MRSPISPRSALAGLIAVSIGGCATHVPQLRNPGESYLQESVRELNVETHIKCEIFQAIGQILAEDQLPENVAARAKGLDRDAQWLRSWGVEATLKLAVDEKAAFTPGITLTQPLRNVIRTFPSGGPVTTTQTRSLGFGGSLSSDANRIETIGFYYSFENADQNVPTGCTPEHGMLIGGDLHIREFLQSKVLISRTPDLLNHPGDPTFYRTFSYQVTFIVTSGGSFTPSWKLVDVLVDPVPPLLSGSRMRTSDLVLTFGPVKNNKLEQEAHDSHLAQLIGQNVAASLNH